MSQDPGDRSPDAPKPTRESRLLSEAEGRRAARVRVDGVPVALRSPLRKWLGRFLDGTRDLEERLAVRLGLELTPRDRIPTPVGPPRELARHPALDYEDLLLDAIDLALRWDEVLDHQRDLRWMQQNTRSGGPHVELPRLRALDRLAQLLNDGGSTHQLWDPPTAAPPRLTRRTDATAQAAADRATAAADATAAGLLRQAWAKAYGRDTDPDGAYLDALRAVETLACPLVLPRNDRASLNSVVQHLSSSGGAAKWELVLAKLGDGSLDPIVAMFDRLWHGNLKARHGGLDYREVTLEEARAGVQLAVVCVQWLTDGVLRERTPVGTS